VTAIAREAVDVDLAATVRNLAAHVERLTARVEMLERQIAEGRPIGHRVLNAIIRPADLSHNATSGPLRCGMVHDIMTASGNFKPQSLTDQNNEETHSQRSIATTKILSHVQPRCT
jgi:hypothetical protein